MMKKSYGVAVDPSFFPLNVGGKQTQVFGYVSDLLAAIAKDQRVIFKRVTVSADDSLLGLEDEKYDGTFSGLRPLISNESKYNFSPLVLRTGPVLIVRQRSTVRSFADLEGKAVAVVRESSGEMVIEKHPEIYVRYYDAPPEALDKLLMGEYDGVLMGYQEAVSFMRDLYRGRIKIVTRPLTDEGLRVVSLKERDSDIVKVFERGLKSLQKKRQLGALLEKWELQP